MDEATQLSLLAGDIYDAALDPSRWAHALEQSAKFLNVSAVTVRVKPDHHLHFGVDPHFQRLYYENFHRCDPRHALSPYLRPGEVASSFDLLAAGSYRESRFHLEFMQPQGVNDNFICVFGDAPLPVGPSCGIFYNSDSGPRDTVLRRMRLLMPHMRRAVLIGKAVGLRAAEASTFAQTLDGLSAGIVFLDARQRIVHANASGHALLALGDPLRAVGGKLVVNDTDGRAAIERAVALAARAGAEAVGCAAALTLKTPAGDSYVMHLLPLTSRARRRATSTYDAVAILFIHKAALALSSPLDAIARRHNLTPTELNVLLAVVEVGGVPETAELLGIARTTAKAHLASIFAKTGARRQADLVKLAAGYSNPLAS